VSVHLLFLVPALFVVVGFVFSRSGVRIRREARLFERVAVRSPGVVTDLRYRSVGREISSGTWFPVVRFETADGHEVETEGMYGRRPPPARRGDEVTVLYDPTDPTRAALEGKLVGGVLGLSFVIGGLMFAALGLLVGGIALFVTLR